MPIKYILCCPACFHMESQISTFPKCPEILLPVSIRTGLLWTEDEHIRLATLRGNGVEDLKISDNRIDLPMRGAMEPNVEELDDGRLIMVMRSQLGAVFISYSQDKGQTWSKPQTSGLRAPESCNTLRKIPGTNDLLLVWNNSEYDMGFVTHLGRRNPLTAVISQDCGQTWKICGNFVDDDAYASTNASVTFFDNGKRAIVPYWQVKYDSENRMIGRLSLKAALIDTAELYNSIT